MQNDESKFVEFAASHDDAPAHGLPTTETDRKNSHAFLCNGLDAVLIVSKVRPRPRSNLDVGRVSSSPF